MRKLYAKWEPQIQTFLVDNGLDYSKVKSCGKAVGIIGGKKTLLLQDISSTDNVGLSDDTPAPIVLKAVEENGHLVFIKTDLTNEYFR